eukprot:CAMPEP_0172595714 /NCGR_PEP_ID=MMETSP1068-20121228/15331_1 /TAXON_ID=35684 /ORGANISM="Pseudopedinella elastica, Strain CCMP716" /LENGTH=298 /DNA_ID=CAMNT_0013394369 /DNA_START=66 /DNA_END=962 /DNA_ORIENTATION=+
MAIPRSAAGWANVADPLEADIIDQFFKKNGVVQRRGTYLEMGAVDGVSGSHSIFFDEHLGWNGVLLEANRLSCEKLFKEPRRSRAIKLCTSCCQEPNGYLAFERTNDPFVSASMDAMTDKWRKDYHTHRDGQAPAELEVAQVPCSPLGRLLRIVGIQKIDFFSLDVEGAEMAVLNSFDWSIPVRVFIIEVQPENTDALAKLLTSHGYKLTDFDVPRKWEVHGADQLWVHKDYDSDWDKDARWEQYSPPQLAAGMQPQETGGRFALWQVAISVVLSIILSVSATLKFVAQSPKKDGLLS